MFLSPCNCANLHIHEKKSYKICNDTLNCVNKPILCNFLKPLLLVHVWCLCPFTIQEASQVCTSQMWNGSHICHAWMWWPMKTWRTLKTWGHDTCHWEGGLLLLIFNALVWQTIFLRLIFWNLVTPSTWDVLLMEICWIFKNWRCNFSMERCF
jgi:hypothetical protein